jgi:hypothetical protein
MRVAIASIATIFAVFATSATGWCAGPEAPDPSPWSFLAGSWSIELPDGMTRDFTCKLNKAKNCYVMSSDVFQGTFGIDTASDHSLLALGYHPGAGYSVGHFKRVSDKVVSGKYSFFDLAGKETEHTGVWEKTDYGYSYAIDKKAYRWTRK